MISWICVKWLGLYCGNIQLDDGYDARLYILWILDTVHSSAAAVWMGNIRLFCQDKKSRFHEIKVVLVR